LESAAVRREQLQQAVLDDDRQPEGDEQGRQQVLAQRAVEQEPLQRVPIAAISGTTTSSEASGPIPSVAVTTSARYAASTIRSPCAMLTRRMTPKISDSPAANRA
jgi:hypothetical protein